MVLSKRSGTILGGDGIIVSGIPLLESDRIVCQFGKSRVDGVYIGEDQAVCVTPPARQEGMVEFVIEIKRGSRTVTGGASYQYSEQTVTSLCTKLIEFALSFCIVSPENAEESVGVETTERVVWSSGERADISWNPESLVVQGVTDPASVKVDVSLLTFNSDTEDFEETATLATGLPNSGSASVSLPDSPDVQSNYGLRPAIVKVDVNTSTATSRSKRFIPAVLKLGLYGKLLLTYYVKSSGRKRVLCEGWKLSAAPFPTRAIPPCPCDVTDADSDSRYVEETGTSVLRNFFHPGSSKCYRQANVRQVN